MTFETCPRCGSPHTRVKQTGRRSGAVIGLAAGASSGAAGAIYGARSGYSVGSIAGPAGGAFGFIAGAILGALAGGTAGCITGITIGRVVDDNLLGNRHCRGCGYVYFTSAPNYRQRDMFDAEDIDPHNPDYPYPPTVYGGLPGAHA